MLDLIWPSLARLRMYPTSVTTWLVFAFGRNTYEDSALNKVMQIRDRAGDNESALRRLMRLSVDPGDSNRALAEMVIIGIDKAGDGNGPKRVILQWEVALAIFLFYEHWFFDMGRQGITVTLLWPRLVLTRFPWKHTIGYDTIAVAQDARRFCNGVVAVLCHRNHLARAAKTAALVLQKPIYLAARKNEYPDVYDPDSVQKQCQAPSSFALLREIVARMRLLAKAKKLAKSL
ncbi:MAG: hypothetical protein NTY11_01570 [Candidatus Parcubacteria bacterium]|nr:hypothetical protein [Candidatus Parcubacteria bacterium]